MALKFFVPTFSLLILCACGNAQASNICWVERVTAHGPKKVHVLLTEEYRSLAPRTLKDRKGKSSEIKLNRDGSFTLRKGESALLSTLPGDACTVEVATANGALGVNLSATACMPSPIGCQESNVFVAAE